ncbi:MerR family transcriptional regulator [Nonomuraea wenchangensis]|uniref:MerR family transcriptional regulator n=1 Tax=Nonomuraea wenchangensis TaxID=568860 RepID=UPI00379414A6
MHETDLMLPGQFAAATRLSPKALRLYAAQGLLAPVGIDPDTGYRRYHRDQVPLGRLIVRLRALGLPLARIAALLPLSPQARQAELRAWLAAQETELRHRRELSGWARPSCSAMTGSAVPTSILRRVARQPGNEARAPDGGRPARATPVIVILPITDVVP